MRVILKFLKDLYSNKSTLIGLAKNDFKARFAKSFLGITWAFMQPLVTLLVMWFVFQAGFKNKPIDDMPFIVWLTPAYLVWSFFAEALVSVTNSLIEYQYLLKQVNFRTSIIPLVKIISSAFVHVVFIFFIFFILAVYGIPFSVYNFQVIYYFLCAIVLLIGLGWLLSALSVFVPDVVNIINVVIQIGFWATPIFWVDQGMSPVVKFILQINPMYYICQGYRDSFISHVWFWERPGTTIMFWVITSICFMAGIHVFRKLKPYLVDIL